MKKITILFAALMVVVSVSASEPKEKETVKPIELTKATFWRRCSITKVIGGVEL
jgi:hypothetical protein